MVEFLLKMWYSYTTVFCTFYIKIPNLIYFGRFYKMSKGIKVTAWSPHRVKKYYLDNRRRGTNMQKLAFEMLERGYQVVCVYARGLNCTCLRPLILNPYGLSDARTVLYNYLFKLYGYHGNWDVVCIDMSHPDAFFFAYK